MKIILFLLISLVSFATSQVDYNSQIQPIFNSNCTSYCHTNGGSYQGGLDLNSYSNLMEGSNSGPVIMPYYSDYSLLIQKLQGTAQGGQMPDAAPPLDTATIALIAAWIDEGALETPSPFSGCTYPEATNYNPDATDDDGSCDFMWGDVNHDGQLTIQDLILIVNEILNF